MEQHPFHTEVVLSKPAPAVSGVQPAPKPQFSAASSSVPPLSGKKKRRKPGIFLRGLKLLVLILCTSLLSLQLFHLFGSDSAATNRVYRNNLPSVVLITAEASADGTTFSGGTGTGVILSRDGRIATNAHVVNGASRITVTLHSQKVLTAEVLGIDENTDLAVLKIDARGLQPAKLASSARIQRLRIGDAAIVIGNPLGTELTDTLTTGVISAVDRAVEVGASIVGMLQTDAAVSPGNSGGPLFDAQGQVIGIITSKVVEDGAEGIGFAIPADFATRILDELTEYGYVRSRPMLGVVVQTSPDNPGIFVKEINEGNNAWLAGLRTGDRILQFDGYDVQTANQVNFLKEQHKIGDTVTMKILRDGKELLLQFRLEGAK